MLRRNPQRPALLLLLLMGCRSANNTVPRTGSLTDGPGPTLTSIDSIVLEENDSVFLARPEMSLTVDDRGMLYIADEMGNRLIRYTPAGSIDRVFGRSGDGPGEMRSTQRVTLLLDTIVLQSTAGKLMAFHRESGRYLFQKMHERSFLLPPAYAGDTVFLPLFNPSARLTVLLTTRTALMRVDSSALATPLQANLIAIPPEYQDHPSLRSFGMAALVQWSDTLLVGFTNLPYLVLYSRAGEPLDTIIIPSRLRRGHPKGWLESFDRGRQPSLQQTLDAMSFLQQFWRLPNGDFLLWHQENRLAPHSNRNYPRLQGMAYVSILSADRTRACLDTPVPFPGTEWPRLGAKGDTLLAIDQIAGDQPSDSVKTIIRRYVVTTDNCRWVPLR